MALHDDERRSRLLALNASVRGFFEMTVAAPSMRGHPWRAAFRAVRTNDHLAEGFLEELQALLDFIDAEFGGREAPRGRPKTEARRQAPPPQQQLPPSRPEPSRAEARRPPPPPPLPPRPEPQRAVRSASAPPEPLLQDDGDTTRVTLPRTPSLHEAPTKLLHLPPERPKRRR
jgi:hypothetical protein